MSDAVTVISAISVLVSSVALVGVVLSLVLQARQLRVMRYETAKTLQSDYIRMIIDYPESYVDPEDEFADEAGQLRKRVLMNWSLKQLETGYAIGVVNETSIRDEAAAMFVSSFRRDYWERFGSQAYAAAANGRARRRFVKIIDEVFYEAQRHRQDPKAVGEPRVERRPVDSER